MKAKALHLNVPQITNQLIQATKSYHVWARGTGKTTGILAPWYIQMAHQMPRGQHGIVGSTFQQLLTRTLPPIFEMWQRMGYIHGKHFVFGHEPSDKFKRMYNWHGPYTKPLDSKYAIYWFNGSVQILISQDRIGTSNGLSLVSLGGDEAKLLNKDRLDDETIPALRGNRGQFGHLPCYRAECYTTDMPTNPNAKWILDMADEMDNTQIHLILQTQLLLNLRQKELLTAKGGRRNTLTKSISKLQNTLLKLRMPQKISSDNYKYSVYYSEASALDNVAVLGEAYLSDMKRILSNTRYQTSILNKKLLHIEEGFYGNLNPDLHGTDWFNYNYLDNFIGDIHNPELSSQSSKQDAGFIASQPLDVAFDYGDKINCMVVAQESQSEYRFLNCFYVLHPQLIDSVVNNFCKYYSNYPTKVVNYYYDHTAMPGSGVTNFNYLLRVLNAFKKNNWTVREFYIGQAPPHETKFEFINLMLREENPRLPKFRYSRTNCHQWEFSALNAGLKSTNYGFKKDKAPERNPNVPPEEATHLSDAGDTLLFGKFSQKFEEISDFIPMT